MTILTTITVDQLQNMQGKKVGISPWIQLPQSMLNQFADITNDHQFIHVDTERAGTESPFGGTIAHGFLTLSQLTQMAESTLPVIEGLRMSINYGSDLLPPYDLMPAYVHTSLLNMRKNEHLVNGHCTTILPSKLNTMSAQPCPLYGSPDNILIDYASDLEHLPPSTASH